MIQNLSVQAQMPVWSKSRFCDLNHAQMGPSYNMNFELRVLIFNCFIDLASYLIDERLHWPNDVRLNTPKQPNLNSCLVVLLTNASIGLSSHAQKDMITLR